jgi:tRNA-specific 2-thiouridylase
MIELVSAQNRRISSLRSIPQVGKGKRVVVGFSGGVDSAVASFALKQAGYDVLGIYMKNWDEKEEGFCNADQEESEARQVRDDVFIFD